MILCDFYDLDTDEFHLKLFDTVVQGNIELIVEILKHPQLSKQFDVSYNNHYCIIASILNSQQVNDCHIDFLKLFTQSPLLHKHANPSLCSQEDIFGGALGNAIIFTPIETVRFIGQFFSEKTSNLQELIALSIFNNRKEAFFYLVKERNFVIEKVDSISKALVKFPQVDSEIVDFIKNLKSQSQQNKTTVDTKKTKNSNLKSPKNKPVNSKSFLLKISNLEEKGTKTYWGSKFRQNF